MELLVGLAGAVVGGLLVLVGDSVRRRDEERRYWNEQLRQAAADVVGTFAEAMTVLTAARRTNLDRPDHTRLLYQERNRKWGLLRMTPGAARVGPELVELRDALAALEAAYDEPTDFERAEVRLRSALGAIENVVRTDIESAARSRFSLAGRRARHPVPSLPVESHGTAPAPPAGGG